MSEPIDHAEPREVAEQNRKLKARERERTDALAAMMSQRPTRAWLWWLLEGAHVFASSFSNNPGHMAFNEGERAIGLRVMADIMRVAPDQYVLMAKEAAE